MEEVSNPETGAVQTVLNHSRNNSADHGEDGDWCDEEDTFFDREEEWRRSQFHSIGYRDGLTAGKQASAQEGFNDGFKQSVILGYKWGLVRGVTSALACLSNDLKAKLAGTQEAREKLQNLYESVYSVSAQDALNFYHAEILGSESEEQNSQLGKYIAEFESLLESSTIELHPTVEQHIAGQPSLETQNFSQNT